MGFPWVTTQNFETGTHTMTASSGTLHDFPHYTELARSGLAPYRGAYCARWRAVGGTTASFLREDTAFDLAASGVLYQQWYFCLGRDFVMADGDKFSMLELESTLNTTTEVAAGITRSGNNILFWVGETSAATPSTFVLGTTTTALNRWICAQVKTTLDSGVPNDGRIDAWIDDAPLTAVTGLDQAAIVDAKFGMIGPDAGTSGTFLMDNLVTDDVQLARDKARFRALNAWVTTPSDHVIIGPGCFSIAVIGTSTDAVMTVYDTDGLATGIDPVVIMPGNTANNFVPGHDIFEVSFGCYVVLTGTNVQGFISIDRGGVLSDGEYVSRGMRQLVPKP